MNEKHHGKMKLEIESISIQALQEAHRIHDELGKGGEELLKKNKYGDTALRVDVEAENAVLNILRKHKLPIRVVSEEHGTTDITQNPVYLGILDGLDGSNVYKEQRGKGRYGTMFAVFANLNPLYSEYIFGGIIEHVVNKLYFAVKGEGSFCVENHEKKQIYCSKKIELNEECKIYSDEQYAKLMKIKPLLSAIDKLKSFNPICLRSSCIHYADLSYGSADAVIECTRKGNLEIAVSFPLISESEGVMYSSREQNLSSLRYSSFGQKENITVISACTEQLARNILRVI